MNLYGTIQACPASSPERDRSAGDEDSDRLEIRELTYDLANGLAESDLEGLAVQDALDRFRRGFFPVRRHANGQVKFIEDQVGAQGCSLLYGLLRWRKT